MILWFLLSVMPAPCQGDDNLAALVDILKSTDDASFQKDILKGLSDGLKGRRSVKMPAGWSELSGRLSKSQDSEIRKLVQALSTAFGDAKSVEAHRQALSNPKLAAEERLAALETLLNTGDRGLAPILLTLLGDGVLRGAAVRALGSYEDARTPEVVLASYAGFDMATKRDAINTLSGRKAYAQALVAALRSKTVPRTDVTAFTVRQLGDLKDPEVDKWIKEEWGFVRATPDERLKEIARLKEALLASGTGNASRGRFLFSKTCQQCHTLYGEGGKVGPDITGSNRFDLDYVLQNVLDPSAVVGKDYQAWTIRTKSDRVLSGIIARREGGTLTILTENDTVLIPENEIDVMRENELSMMPEGLFTTLPKEDIRDLVVYLRTTSQVAMAVVQETIFNGKDLTGWDGNPEVWKVEDGELVGRGALKKNEFLYCKTVVADFRLIVEVKLVDDRRNSGIQFRSEKLKDGHARGYQADIGAGWWGKIYDEHGRGLLAKTPGDEFVKKGEWNTVEILAVGSKIRTAINGNLVNDFDDPKPALKGLIAPQVHSGEMTEVRFRNFQLEHNPRFELKSGK